MRNTSNRVTVIIPNWNGASLLPTCLAALAKQKYSDFEVILVDNGSTDDSIDFVRRNYPQVHIHKFGENRGFSAACNAGILAARADYIALLNNDTEPDGKWLDTLVQTMDAAPDSVASLTSKMLNMRQPELVDDAGDFLTWRGGAFKRGHGRVAADYHEQDEVMSACAGAALYRRTALLEVGLLDEKYFAYLEDVDLGLRLCLVGYHCLFVPTAIVLHLGQGSALARKLYHFLSTRNRIFLFCKNIPVTLLLKHSGSLAYGWVFYFLAYNSPLTSVKATLAVVKYLPHIFEARRKIRAQTKLPNAAIDALLSGEWSEISIKQLLSRRWRACIARMSGTKE